MSLAQLSILEAMEQAKTHRRRAQQPRSQSGDLGAAGAAGRSKLEAAQDVPDFPYARYAELIGFTGLRVERPEAIGPAWDQVLASDRPVVLEAITDPNVPPLPLHITLSRPRGISPHCSKATLMPWALSSNPSARCSPDEE
jgi:hypothetical protein